MTDTPPDFNDLFDENDNVKATPQAEPSPPAAPAVGHHVIDNNNMQVGAELNLFFKTAAGFKGHLQLHAPTGKEVLEQSAGALAHFAAYNFVPEYSTAVAASAPAEVAREDLPQDGTASASFCTIHNVEMKRREKDGQVWYSHKIAGTEDWCRGQQ